MKLWVICPILVAGPFADTAEAAKFVTYVDTQTVTLPDGSTVRWCPHEHTVVSAPAKPVLVDLDDAPAECPDCHAPAGTECSWACSSNWDRV